MKKISTVPVRRKREMKTNYRKRLNLLIGGKPRIVIRKSSRSIVLQVVEYGAMGDKVLAYASSQDLKEFGWNAHPGNTPAAYLTGLLLARRAKSKKVREAVTDLGLQAPVKCTRVFAAVKGCQDGGLNVPSGENASPPDQRIRGEHIASYTDKKSQSEHQFKAYSKNNVDPSKITILIEEVKKKIIA